MAPSGSEPLRCSPKTTTPGDTYSRCHHRHKTGRRAAHTFDSLICRDECGGIT
jgi:hypothetical protein